MASLRSRIEEHPVLWALGSVLTGFLAGIGAYQGILRIAKLEVVSAYELQRTAKVDERVEKLEKELVALTAREKFFRTYLAYKSNPNAGTKARFVEMVQGWTDPSLTAEERKYLPRFSMVARTETGEELRCEAIIEGLDFIWPLPKEICEAAARGSKE